MTTSTQLKPEAVESQLESKQLLHWRFQHSILISLSTYGRLVGEVLGVCATGLSPGTNATELTAVLPTDTAYCARLSMRASGVLRVVERRSAEEVAAKKLEARAREPLGQGVGDLPLGPHLNEIDGALSGVLLHLEPPQFEVLAAATQCAGIASEARHAGVAKSDSSWPAVSEPHSHERSCASPNSRASPAK